MKERIKLLRMKLKLSQSEFAERLGISQTHVSALESGRRNISDIIFKYICELWNINPNWLRNGTGEMFVDLSNNIDNIDSDTKDILFKYQQLSKKDKEKMKIILNSFLDIN